MNCLGPRAVTVLFHRLIERALGIEVSHFVHVGENPNVGFRALDTDVRFVGMHQVSRQDPLQNLSMSLAVVRSKILLPLCDGCGTQSQSQQPPHYLCDGSNWNTKFDDLIKDVGMYASAT